MKYILSFLSILTIASAADATGKSVPYEVNGAPYEGYFVSAGPKAPLVLLIHDWDGLTDYEVKPSQS